MENRRTNKEIMAVSYVVLILFVGVIAYLSCFMYKDADYYRNKTFNAKRLSLLEDKFIRGEIKASDGTTLAATVADDNGENTRYYPYGKTFAHVVGYDFNGVTGLESLAGSYLLGSHTNPLLRIVENLRGIKNSGDNVITTLNVKLQQTAYQAMADHKGAVVMMEPDTGRVLAVVSRPGFDPNTIAEDWDDLVSADNSNSNLVNRATQGLYTPGSTFKIMTVLEYMQEYPSSWNSFSYDCDGVFSLEDYKIKCAHNESHGKQDLTEAFANSCNGAFAEMGTQLSFQRFNELMTQIGFNSAPDIRVPVAASKFVLSNNNSTWKILQTSIGQGDTQITPFFNCMIAAAVSNGGVMMNPYLIESVESKYGDKVASFGPEKYKAIMTQAEAAQLKTMMRAVVTDGTGREARGTSPAFAAYGKTGTAQIRTDGDTNAWFIGFAENETTGKKVAVSIILEEGGGGGSAAAPIAGELFDTYFEEVGE